MIYTYRSSSGHSPYCFNAMCQFGQEYMIGGSVYWRCGCCDAPFYFSPIRDDIPHYIKLVELGLKK